MSDMDKMKLYESRNKALHLINERRAISGEEYLLDNEGEWLKILNVILVSIYMQEEKDSYDRLQIMFHLQPNHEFYKLWTGENVKHCSNYLRLMGFHTLVHFPDTDNFDYRLQLNLRT